ncbi:hypothetical protein [Photobacterium damselae]|uniref:hypothetical protein n=1 Tax=Photobacterium damselae TaxID=38293 RepID=UPI001F1D9429|nr:hypothetical protein [Photobacterium damselae]UKA03841.1 hypothetical protein IHC89_15020 [Photobacterium damselae subsp. damselae]
MPNYINYVATFLSIIGGVIAIWQAYKATTEASKAKIYRDEIINVRKAVDFSGIEAVLSRTINLISKYGPSASMSSLSGVSPDKDAEEVQHFVTTLLRKNKILFDGYYLEIDKFCNELSNLLEKLVACNPSDSKLMKSHGTVIYHRLTDFSSILKGNLDLLKEKQTM